MKSRKGNSFCIIHILQSKFLAWEDGEPRVELAAHERFPRDRPQAAPTVARSELLASGSDNTFRRMKHDALAYASRMQAVRDGYAGQIGLTCIRYTIPIAIHRQRHERDANIWALARHLHLSPPL